MAEVQPICLREIVDDADCEYRANIERDVLDALDDATIRSLSRVVNTKTGRVICQMADCSAECRVMEDRSGYIMIEPKIGIPFDTDPVEEKDCAKFNLAR